MKRQTILSYFCADCGRLKRLYGRFLRARKIRPESAAGLLDEFRTQLDRHIAAEEGALLPVFESKMNMKPSGAASLICLIHRQMTDAAKNIGSEGDAKFLGSLIREHNREGVSFLYPEMDKLVSRTELDEILGRIERLGHWLENAEGGCQHEG